MEWQSRRICDEWERELKGDDGSDGQEEREWMQGGSMQCATPSHSQYISV